MELEQTIQGIIYVHAGAGVIALLSGAIALTSKKGEKTHKRSGKVFYYCMLFSGITAMVIATLPKHQSPFLFSIGIFSSYFILTGFRALRFNRASLNIQFDIIISFSMLLTGLAMIFYPIAIEGSANIVLTVFGCVGSFFSIRDLILFNNYEKLRKMRLRLHMVKMVGGYISAVTAFIIVNDVFPGPYGWFIPGVIGTVYIVYWIRKLRTKT